MLAPIFTHSADNGAETLIREMLANIAKVIQGCVPANALRALILLGGYGKGEGGLILKNSEYYPHNNFDLLLVLSSQAKDSVREVTARVKVNVLKLAQQMGIGIDISIMSEDRVRNMPTRVFSYDMKEGHRTLLGDEKFIPSIDREMKDIPGWDVRNLMVNRGSLLLINRLCIERMSDIGEDEISLKKLIIKHTMKAIIGYGDALLYFNGRYHWSYREKYRRILQLGSAHQPLVRLYQDAINFRFTPRYDHYLKLDVRAWQGQVLRVLEHVHLACERTRLNNQSLTWDAYLREALSSLSHEQGYGGRRIGRMLLNLLRPQNGCFSVPGGLVAALGYWTSNASSVLPVLFPLIAFEGAARALPQAGHGFLMNHFGLTQMNDAHLVKKYLQVWGEQFDNNLWPVLKQFNISLTV